MSMIPIFLIFKVIVAQIIKKKLSWVNAAVAEYANISGNNFRLIY